jgi:pimeloyl-ACP methyl ester carboxylesterase
MADMSGGRATPFTDGTVELADGRTLGYAEFGDPDGDVILWFHGTPGARLQVPPEVEIEGRTRGFRVITIERPGNGASTPHLYDRVADFAHDVAHLADTRGVERFACVGLSGGGPYVLGCAHELTDRVSIAVVLGGLGPVAGPDAAPSYTKMLSWFGPVLTATRAPLAEGFSRAMQMLVPVADQALWLYMRFGPSSDRPVFNRPEMQDMFKTDIIGGLAGGMRGPIYDIALFSRHWGFSLADITVPVRFWQGDADLIVPLNHGEHQADLIADSKLFIRPGEGHFAGFTAVDAVLDEIHDTWPDRSANQAYCS